MALWEEYSKAYTELQEKFISLVTRCTNADSRERYHGYHFIYLGAILRGVCKSSEKNIKKTPESPQQLTIYCGTSHSFTWTRSDFIKKPLLSENSCHSKCISFKDVTRFFVFPARDRHSCLLGNAPLRIVTYVYQNPLDFSQKMTTNVLHDQELPVFLRFCLR